MTRRLRVWANARIGVRLLSALGTPSLPEPSEIESESNSKRETEAETAGRSMAGVAFITFLNPSGRRLLTDRSEIRIASLTSALNRT
jgi:hypothetical protein